MAPTLRAAQTGPTVTIRRGSEMAPARYGEILAILCRSWQNADPYLDDFTRVMHNCGGDMLLRLSDDRIDGVLRTKCIRSWDNPHNVPRSLEDLVGPYWSRRDRIADTRVLIDLTKREGATGVASSLIEASP